MMGSPSTYWTSCCRRPVDVSISVAEPAVMSVAPAGCHVAHNVDAREQNPPPTVVMEAAADVSAVMVAVVGVCGFRTACRAPTWSHWGRRTVCAVDPVKITLVARDGMTRGFPLDGVVVYPSMKLVQT